MIDRNIRPASATELVVVDGALPDIDTLVDGIASDKWVVVLDPRRDGVLELGELLADESELDAVHLLSHGGIGRLHIGTAVIDQSSLESFSLALERIGNSIGETGNLLLYGCNVGQGTLGREFIEKVAWLTGVNVAASVSTKSLACVRESLHARAIENRGRSRHGRIPCGMA